MSACGESATWLQGLAIGDPLVAWNAIDRGDWALTICQMLQVDAALVLQATVDAARLAIVELPAGLQAALTAKVDAAEANQAPTNTALKAAITLCGACACGGLRGALTYRAPSPALQASMIAAVKARIPYAKVLERFAPDGQGGYVPIAPVPQ